MILGVRTVSEWSMADVVSVVIFQKHLFVLMGIVLDVLLLVFMTIGDAFFVLQLYVFLDAVEAPKWMQFSSHLDSVSNLGF